MITFKFGVIPAVSAKKVAIVQVGAVRGDEEMGSFCWWVSDQWSRDSILQRGRVTDEALRPSENRL